MVTFIFADSLRRTSSGLFSYSLAIAIGHLSAVTVAPITSTVRGVPSEMILDVDDGMKHRCAVNLHNVVTVSQERMGKRVASLSEQRMQEVCVALRFSLGCL